MTAILVVDDQKELRAVVRRVLTEAGHEVAEAEDGDAALAAFRANPPALVITDIIMPEKAGIEVIATMKRERPEVKVLAMSGGGRHRVMDFLAIAREAGADAALEKPFRKSELLARVAELIGPALPS
jgi:DNA-binding response OmpR family regulator